MECLAESAAEGANSVRPELTAEDVREQIESCKLLVQLFPTKSAEIVDAYQLHSQMRG